MKTYISKTAGGFTVNTHESNTVERLGQFVFDGAPAEIDDRAKGRYWSIVALHSDNELHVNTIYADSLLDALAALDAVFVAATLEPVYRVDRVYNTPEGYHVYNAKRHKTLLAAIYADETAHLGQTLSATTATALERLAALTDTNLAFGKFSKGGVDTADK